jgi:dTDP-4-dehydrorhamnose reductase
MKVLVIGATGMLGYSLFKNLNDANKFDVYGTVRSIDGKEHFFSDCEQRLFKGVDVSKLATLESVLKKLKPAVVINCIGLIKQHSVSKQHIDAISINSLLPHQLATLCDRHGCKLIHFSTDCVFDGVRGLYTEQDKPDAKDLYGRSKCLGEVDYAPHLTLRTSIIGHELNSSVSLIDWFLSQEGQVSGYSKAIFSGLPTCYIAQLLIDKIEELMGISGLYHLSVEPINKYDLLKIVSEVYQKEINIIPNETLVIDRSLSSLRLQNEINFSIKKWNELIQLMYKDYQKKYVQ